MLKLANGSIRAYFASSLAEAMELSSPALIITPINSTWNDFGFNFYTELHLLTAPQEVSFTADMRLMFSGVERTFTHLTRLFAQFGPLIPCDQVKDVFCSILLNDSSYRKLVSELTLEEAVHGLRQIGDAVVLEAEGGTDPRVELIRSKPFHLGVFRASEAYFSWRRAKRHLRHNPPGPVDDAASNFLVQVQFPGLATAYKADFDFKRDELLRNRIAVLIGRNGVGKTQLLLSLIKAATRSAPTNQVPGAIAEAQVEPEPSFNSLLAFSSVSSDLYPEAIAPWEGGVDYNYFSLIAREPREASTAANPLTASLVDIIRSKDQFELPDEPGLKLSRSNLLKRALGAHIQYGSIHLPLSPETPDGLVWSVPLPDGKYASLQAISGEQRTLEVIQSLDWTRPPRIVEDGNPRALSSGQLAMLRFAVQSIGAVQRGSLLLMDEPETHLHPNFISMFVEILHAILDATRSCAIIATHSAYIVREVPRSRVLVLRIEDGAAEISKPRLQTFGASIDSISHFVFGDAEMAHLHEILLQRWLSAETSIDVILEKHGDELNPESLSYIRRVLAKGEHQ